MRNMNSVKVRRDHKDTLFRMIFSTRENLLSLYNAVNHSHYTDAKELEIVTLENAVYMNMKINYFSTSRRMQHQSTLSSSDNDFCIFHWKHLPHWSGLF